MFSCILPKISNHNDSLRTILLLHQVHISAIFHNIIDCNEIPITNSNLKSYLIAIATKDYH